MGKLLDKADLKNSTNKLLDEKKALNTDARD